MKKPAILYTRMSRSISSMIMTIFLTISCAHAARAEVNTISQQIYRFDPRADALLAKFFKGQFQPSHAATGYIVSTRPTDYPTLDDALRDFDRMRSPRKLPVDTIVDMGNDLLDSYWLNVGSYPPLVEQLLDESRYSAILNLLDQLNSTPLHFGSVLEKSLFQRDIYQMF